MTATIPVGISPIAVAITPDGSRAYVVNLGSDTLSIIDTATNLVMATVATQGTCSVAIAITPAAVPTSKDQCKNGGWRTFGAPAGPFRNQGDCVRYVERNRGRHD